MPPVALRLAPSLRHLAIAAGALAAGGALQAEESFIVGPRALGMGGANAAVVNDVQAQYYNPAAFGFFGFQPPVAEQDDKGAQSVDNNELWRKRFGFDADFSAGIRIHEQFAEYADKIKKLNDDGTINRLTTNGVVTQADASALLDIANALGNLDDPKQALTSDFNGGAGIRIGHFGIGARIYSEIAVRESNLDLTNLGLGGTDLNNGLNPITPTGNDGQTSLFTPAQIAQLEAGPNGLSAANVQKLDYLARQNGVTSAETQQLVNVVAGVNAAGNGGNLDQNTSALRLYGFGLAEIPVTYGYAFNEHFSVGVTGKLMIGRVYGDDVLVFQNGAADSLKDAKKDYEQTVTGGVDAGVMARFKYVNLALVGRNLNAPTFKGPTSASGFKFDDYKLDPEARAGAAFIPFSTLAFEVDLDLTRNKTILTGYDTQNLSAGLEWNAFHFLALRAGAYKNLAEKDVGTVVTGGLGINLWLLRIDAAVAMALKKTTFDDRQIPREARGALQLAVDF